MLIIGIGNTLRSDDGVGVRLVEQFERELAAGTLAFDELEIEVEAVHQLFPELAADLSRSDYVLFSDACVDLSPGELSLMPIEAVATSVRQPVAHSVEIPFLMKAAEEVFGSAPKAALLRIGAESVTLSETLTAKVEAALPQALEMLVNQLKSWSSQEQ